jgi:hypothetical protein
MHASIAVGFLSKDCRQYIKSTHMYEEEGGRRARELHLPSGSHFEKDDPGPTSRRTPPPPRPSTRKLKATVVFKYVFTGLQPELGPGKIHLYRFFWISSSTHLGTDFMSTYRLFFLPTCGNLFAELIINNSENG